MESKIVRTRIAPSPTGFPHIGTIYQALFDFAYAKRYKGQFLVRIEDTDRERFVEGAEKVIQDSFAWFGLNPDESPWSGGPVGPYRQSERKEEGIYEKYAQQLVQNGHAYYCFCTKERLDQMRKAQQDAHVALVMYDKHCRTIPPSDAIERKNNGESCVVRMKIPEKTKIIVNDGIRGTIEFASETVDDQVILKSDGYPTYHLAVVVDDHLMKITDVVRGEEWITSFPKHILLYEYLGWEIPNFYHTPVLRNPDKSKLSKRHGHTSVEWYKEEGFLPEAILNFLALMGWSNPNDHEKEVFQLDEFIKSFDLKDLRPVGPIFDLKKLEWMNGLYMREQLSTNELIDYLYEYHPDFKSLDREIFEKWVEVLKTRSKTLKEFVAMYDLVNNTVPQVGNSEIKKSIRSDLEHIEVWDKDSISEIIIQKYIMGKLINLKSLYKMLFGLEQGPPLADTFELLGKEKTISLFS